MRKKIKEARVCYNDELDSFDIEILTKDGWIHDRRYFCEDVNPDPYQFIAAEYIHFGILTRIADLQYLGYNVKFVL